MTMTATATAVEVIINCRRLKPITTFATCERRTAEFAARQQGHNALGVTFRRHIVPDIIHASLNTRALLQSQLVTRRAHAASQLLSVLFAAAAGDASHPNMDRERQLLAIPPQTRSAVATPAVVDLKSRAGSRSIRRPAEHRKMTNGAHPPE